MQHRALKIVLCVIAGAALATSFRLRAADAEKPNPVAGIWRWSFTNSDGGQITPRVRFKEDEERGLVGTSRFRAGNDAPVSNLSLKGDQLNFDVVRERDSEQVVTHYSGTLSGDKIKGTITSKSAGEEQTFPWEAERLTDVDGTWKWRFAFGGRGGAGGGRQGGGGPGRFPGGGGDATLTLKRDGEKVAGKLAGFGPDADIHHGRFRNGTLSFETERQGRDGGKSTNFYRGKLEADRIVGFLVSSSGERRTNAWVAVRAD